MMMLCSDNNFLAPPQRRAARSVNNENSREQHHYANYTRQSIMSPPGVIRARPPLKMKLCKYCTSMISTMLTLYNSLAATPLSLLAD